MINIDFMSFSEKTEKPLKKFPILSVMTCLMLRGYTKKHWMKYHSTLLVLFLFLWIKKVLIYAI